MSAPRSPFAFIGRAVSSVLKALSRESSPERRPPEVVPPTSQEVSSTSSLPPEDLAAIEETKELPSPSSSNLQVFDLLSPLSSQASSSGTRSDSPSQSVSSPTSALSSTMAVTSPSSSGSRQPVPETKAKPPKRSKLPTSTSMPELKIPPVTAKPIVWKVNEKNVTYDEAHADQSGVHPIRTPHGKQFLLFKLAKEDFTDTEAYRSMQAIAEHPEQARQQGDSGVIFLGETKAPAIEKMTPQQKVRFDVKRGKDGLEFIPTVKIKILGGGGKGDIRAYGFSVKTANNEVLNVVTALEEGAHKTDQRKKRK